MGDFLAEASSAQMGKRAQLAGGQRLQAAAGAAQMGDAQVVLFIPTDGQHPCVEVEVEAAEPAEAQA